MSKQAHLSVTRWFSARVETVARNEQRAVMLLIGVGGMLWLISWIPEGRAFWAALHTASGGTGGSWHQWLSENWQENLRGIAKGVLSGSALVAILVSYLRQSGVTIDKFQVAWLIRDHAIICGLTDESCVLAESLVQSGIHVVVVAQDASYEAIALLRAKGIFVIPGEPANAATLDTAGLQHARMVVCLDSRDERNMAVLDTLRALAGAPETALSISCYCQVADGALRSQLARFHLVEAKGLRLRVRVFSTDELSAAALLEKFPPERHLPLGQQASRTHVALLGGGHFAMALAEQMAQQCHYWRPIPDHTQPRARLTIVAPDAEQVLACLGERIPGLGEFLELAAIPALITRPDIVALLHAASPVPVSQYFVAAPDEMAVLMAATGIGRDLARSGNCRDGQVVAVLLAQQHPVAPDLWRGNANLAFFEGRDSCTAEVIIGGARDKLAKAAHARYLEHALQQGQLLGARPNLLPWEDLDEFFRSSNRQQVAHQRVKERALMQLQPTGERQGGTQGAASAEVIEQLADMEHRRWMAFYRVHGWIYASRRDDALQVHDCLIPYVDLPESVKRYSREAACEIVASSTLSKNKIEGNEGK